MDRIRALDRRITTLLDAPMVFSGQPLDAVKLGELTLVVGVRALEIFRPARPGWRDR